LHEVVELGVSGFKLTSRAARSSRSGAVAVAPILSALSVGTIPGHVTSVATDATDDVCGKVALFRAVVLAVSDLATVLAGLVFVVTKGTVESCELTELVALELVLAFGDRSGLQWY
jgi:hypothetical protein